MNDIMKRKRVWAILFFAAAAAACGPAGKPAGGPAGPSDADRLAEAIRLRENGSYVSLKKAFGLFEGLSAKPSLRGRTLVPCLETALLLAARGKELSIADSAPLAAADRLIREQRSLAGYRTFLDIAIVLSVKTKGVLTDIDNKFAWVESQKDLASLEPALRQRALEDEFCAVLYASWIADRFDYSKLEGLREVFDRHPASKSLIYKAATSRQAPDAEALRKLLALDPGYAEAHFHLGQAALGQGLLLEAEKEFLASYADIPESPETRILLASIYFASEETEKSLEFYEKTLEVAPEYRDAILGKAICLTSLGRNAEAIAVLDTNLALGYWLLGETHFWLAWNRHELKENDKAAVHIEEAKTRLGTAPEVFALSGTIRFELGELVRAEADYRQALNVHRYHTDALLGLGNVLVKKETWLEAGDSYLEAAGAFRASVIADQSKIDEIKASKLPAERKERLLKKKSSQLEAHIQSEAMAFYLAAASLANGGRAEEALRAAEKAAGHPVYKEKAEELAARIRASKSA
jgi:tetratricopeptide (TPR) repeat protein